MIAELVFSLFLVSNEPMYLQSVGRPYSRMVLSLELQKPMTNRLTFTLTPYVLRSWARAGRVGSEAEIMYRLGDVRFGFYHHSSHNLDREGTAIEVDGVRMKWKLK